MNLSIYNTTSACKSRSGFTLMELMIAFVIAIVVVGVIVALSIISAHQFLATTNYVSMDNQSRNAVDKLSREIRNATALVSFTTNNPQTLVLTNRISGTSSTITYDSSASTLQLAKSGETAQTLLTGCDSFSFQLYDRYPLITATNISFYSSTNAVTTLLDAKFCKVINMNWKCSRTILGSKLNTEIVQTAQVVIRNQVSY